MKINDWEFNQEILDWTFSKLRSRREEGNIIFPNQLDIFKAFELCSYKDVKVVILGQDSYHNEINGGPMANGLAFSQRDGSNYDTPPSLKNILSELEIDIYNYPFNEERLELKNTEAWGERQAKQGVLLLNTALTVEKGAPASHLEIWQDFTQQVLLQLQNKESLVWVLWGEHAKKFKKFIPEHHKVIEGVHPSPLSSYRGFFGSRPFSKVNEYLEEAGLSKIIW